MIAVLLFVVGGIVLTLGAIFIYMVVIPTTARGAPRPAVRPGRQCVYCHSGNTRRLAQEPRYDDHGFSLITSYECVRCGLPFWSVDRARQQGAVRK